MRRSFVLYYDFKEPLEELSDKDKGQVLMAMFEYCEYGTIPQLSKQAAIAFKFLKKFLDIDREKYEEKCNKRREAGKLGGRPKKSDAEEKAKQKEEKKAASKEEPKTEDGKKETKEEKITNDKDKVSSDYDDFFDDFFFEE